MISSNFLNDRFYKIISIINFFLILFVLAIVLNVGPASSYEFSIYDAYPTIFWALFLAAIICGQVIIILSAISQSRRDYWLFGLGAILILNAVLLFMPIIRGYYFSDDADILTHVGYMQDILRTSSFGGNHYPINHILGVIVHLVSGLSLPAITLIIPPVFSFFFLLSIYFVGKTIFQNKFELLILVILSSILTFGNGQIFFAPNSQAFFLIPLIIFLAFKMYQNVNNKQYNFLLLLISCFIVFYHPLVSVMVIFILCLMQIMHYVLEKYGNVSVKKVNYTYTIFFIVMVFSMWSTYLSEAVRISESIFSRILGNEQTMSELQNKVDLVSQVNIDPFYLFKLIMNVYGPSILLGILSVFCIGLILKAIKNQKTTMNFYVGISITGYIVLAMLSIAIFLTINNFGFRRIYHVATLFSLLLIPIGIYLFIYSNAKEKSLTGKKIIKLFGVIFLFGCITYFSIFNVYYAPVTKVINTQVPKNEYIGMNTFFSIRNESLSILEFGPTSYRFYDAIYGQTAKRSNIYYFDEVEKMTPPDHFGYQNETLSGNFYSNSRYILLNYEGRGFYQNLYPEFENKWRFSVKDFERLKYDSQIQQVYSNGDLEIFMLT